MTFQSNSAALRALVFAAFTAFTALHASAAPRTFSFNGTVTDDPFGLGFTSFTGSYTFDSDAPDSVPDPNTGSYTSTGAGFGMEVELINGGTTTVSAFGSLNVGIANDYPGPIDQYTATALEGSTTLEVFLEDNSASALVSDALPLLPPDLLAFQLKRFRWFDTDAEILGDIQVLECTAGCDSVPTPEPSTLWLAAAALALLGRRASRRGRSL